MLLTDAQPLISSSRSWLKQANEMMLGADIENIPCSMNTITIYIQRTDSTAVDLGLKLHTIRMQYKWKLNMISITSHDLNHQLKGSSINGSFPWDFPNLSYARL